MREVVLPTRRRAYGTGVGLVVALLAVGLAMPYVFGDPVAVRTTGAGNRFAVDDAVTGDGVGGDGAVVGEPAVGDGNGGLVGPSGGTGGSAGAPTTPQGGTGGPGGGGGGGGGTSLRATDRGVTPEAITVGVLVGDATGASQLGIDTGAFSPVYEKSAWQAHIDELNSRGGINGRQVRAVYAVYDALDSSKAQAACLELTQDKKVFTVFNWGLYDGVSKVACITERGRTPLMKGDPEATEEAFAVSRGYLSTSQPRYERAVANMAAEVHRLGRLTGKNIGILGRETMASLPRELTAALRELGYSVAHTSRLSADTNTAQSQIPGEVQQMKQKNVGVVFMVDNLLTQSSFVQQAEVQQFFPLYAVTDVIGSAEDINTQSMPSSFDGALGVTYIRSGEWRTNIPEAPADQRCRAVFEKRSGQQLPRNADDQRNVVMTTCDIVERFAAAARAAGPELTRDRLVGALQGLGAFQQPYTGGGSFGPGKFDAADYVRVKRWAASCRCFTVIEDFRPARY